MPTPRRKRPVGSNNVLHPLHACMLRRPRECWRCVASLAPLPNIHVTREACALPLSSTSTLPLVLSPIHRASHTCVVRRLYGVRMWSVQCARVHGIQRSEPDQPACLLPATCNPASQPSPLSSLSTLPATDDKGTALLGDADARADASTRVGGGPSGGSRLRAQRSQGPKVRKRRTAAAADSVHVCNA